MDEARTAHAEVERVWPRSGEIRVEGRLHGLDAPDGDWRAVLSGRNEPTRTLEYPVQVDGGSFAFAFPIEDLVTPWILNAAPDSGQQWNIHLHPAGEGPRLHVGRHLDDIVDRREVFVYPAQRTGPDGRLLVRPFYTPRSRLVVRCRKPPAG